MISRDATKLKKMFEDMVSDRHNWDDHWNDVLNYVAPQKNRVYIHNSTTQPQGDQRNQRLYDSSAQHFNELLASALHSMLTNPTVNWFGLSSGDQEIDRKSNVRKFFQKFTQTIHDILSNSNFQTEIHELYMDLGSLGTGIMFIDEDEEDQIRFFSYPVFQLYLRESSKGMVDTVARKFLMTGRKALQEYGDDPKVWGQKVLSEINQDLNKEIELVHITMPRIDRDKSKKNPQNKKYASVHLYLKEPTIIKESGYDNFPWVAPRWTKLSNEVYGRSPAMKTLPDIRMVNAMMKTVIRGAQKAVDPPWLIAHDSVLGRLNLKPGGTSAVRQGMTGQESIRPLVSGARTDLGLDMIQRVRESIKQGFFIDQLQLGGSDRMTQLEVNIRNDENLRLLSPILGRLHSELLQPLISRIITIMSKRGLIPQVPEELAGVNPQVFYRSQIAKAQKAGEGRVVSNYMAELLQTSQIKPDVLDLVDFDKMAKYKAQVDGVPELIFNNDEEVEELRNQRAEQQAAAQELEEQQVGAEMIQKAGPTIQNLEG